MKRLLIVRHAESAMNLVQDDIVGGRSNSAELSTAGKKQPQALARFMRAKGLDQIDFWRSSPAVRTIGTGEITLRALNIYRRPVLDERLQEMSQGEMEGLKRSDVYTPKIIEKIKNQQKDFALPGGESMNQVGQRANQALEHWAITAPTDSLTLMTTHGFWKRCLLAHRENLSHREIRDMHTPNCCATLVTEQ